MRATLLVPQHAIITTTSETSSSSVVPLFYSWAMVGRRVYVYLFGGEFGVYGQLIMVRGVILQHRHDSNSIIIYYCGIHFSTVIP